MEKEMSRSKPPTLTRTIPSSTRRSVSKKSEISQKSSDSFGEDVDMKDPSRHSSEITLKKFGYTPVQRVSIDNHDGSQHNNLKCQSPLGFYVFVLIDDDKIVSFSSDNLAAKEMAKGEVLPIPQSLSNGFYHDSGNVVVLCKEGLCEMKHDGLRVDPLVSNFSFVSETRSRVIVPENSFLAYPLISISEIKSNPKLVLTTTMTSTNRLREVAYLKCYQQIGLFVSRLNTLSTNTNLFIEQHKKIASELDSYIKSKTDAQMALASKPAKSSVDVERQWNNLYNLNLRHSMVVKFLGICAKYGELSEKITAINGEVESLNEILSSEFASIEVDKHRPLV